MKEEKNITIADCHKLQNYAKVLYEQGKYKDAERLLYSLKEILVNESQQNSELMLQVFWGLLACEILNGKGRDVVEHTSLKKMRELIERKYSNADANSFASHDHTQSIAWMLHWLLIYSFTAKDLTNSGLFATILADQNMYGSRFMHLVQMRSDVFSKYAIVSFLLARGQPMSKYQIGKNSLEKIALPLALSNLHSNPDDPFCGFLKALYEDYDLEKAA